LIVTQIDVSNQGAPPALGTATTDGLLNIATVVAFVALALSAIWRCMTGLATREPSMVSWTVSGGDGGGEANDVAVLAIIQPEQDSERERFRWMRRRGAQSESSESRAPVGDREAIQIRVRAAPAVVLIRGARGVEPPTTTVRTGTGMQPEAALRCMKRIRIGSTLRSPSSAASTKCAICQNQLHVGEAGVKLRACGHTLHKHCCMQWLTRVQATCPVCGRSALAFSAHEASATAVAASIPTVPNREEWMQRQRAGASGLLSPAPTASVPAGNRSAPTTASGHGTQPQRWSTGLGTTPGSSKGLGGGAASCRAGSVGSDSSSSHHTPDPTEDDHSTQSRSQ
jgi:hypothetical protein